MPVIHIPTGRCEDNLKYIYNYLSCLCLCQLYIIIYIKYQNNFFFYDNEWLKRGKQDLAMTSATLKYSKLPQNM